MVNLLYDIELVIWSPRSNEEPPTVQDVADALAAQNFKAALAEEVPVKTAFRRTVSAIEGKDAEGVRLKASFVENGRLRGQIDRVLQDHTTGRIRREFVGGWVLKVNDNGESTGDCDRSSDTPEDISAKVIEAKKQYTWADVSGIVQEILKTEGLGAYSLRRSGGVYVCPTRGREMLDRLGRFADRIGLNLLRYDIPDNRAQRDEIENAIADSVTADCLAHELAMDGYSPEQTKVGVVSNRIEAIKMTQQLAGRVTIHMGERAAPLMERIAKLQERAEEIEKKCKEFRPATTGGRRISFAGAQ